MNFTRNDILDLLANRRKVLAASMDEMKKLAEVYSRNGVLAKLPDFTAMVQVQYTKLDVVDKVSAAVLTTSEEKAIEIFNANYEYLYG